MKKFLVSAFDFETEKVDNYTIEGNSFEDVMNKLARKYLEEIPEDVLEFFSPGEWFREQLESPWFPMDISVQELRSNGSLSKDLLLT